MSAFDGKVVGYQNQVKQLMQIADMLKTPDKYKNVGANIVHNAILVGTVGLGKSLMAECFLEETGHTSYIIRRKKSAENFIQEITDTFDKAKAHQPSVILCDDLDHWKSGPDDEETFTTLVSVIDEIKNENVFVISTVNDLSILPRQLTRKGRMDVILHFDYPEDKDVQAILEHFLKNKHLADDVNIADLAKIFSGKFSVADVEAQINLAAVDAAYDGKTDIPMKYLVNSALRTKYDYIDGFEEVEPKDKEITCWHEVCHIALLEIMVPESVGWASVRARGYSDLSGFVSKCKDIKNRDVDIMAALAGKVGSELKYPGVAQGTLRDLSIASDYIIKNVQDIASNGLALLDIYGDPVMQSSDYMQRLQTVVTAELERYSVLCRRVLLDNMPFLEKLHKAMMEKEVLLYSDIQNIKASCSIIPLNV